MDESSNERDRDISFYGNKHYEKGEEPFLLPFGHRHGDEFLRKDDYNWCFRYEFSHSQLAMASQLFQLFSFCFQGALHMEQQLVFAIYRLKGVNTQDNLIDYICSESYLNEQRWSV